MFASIYVQPMIVEHFKRMLSNSYKKLRRLKDLSLEVENADALKEDQTVGIKVFAHYQDGAQVVLKADKVTFSTTGEGDVAVRKGMLELHKPGAGNFRKGSI